MGEIKRRITKKISVGNTVIGGNSPIAVQSMTKTDSRDVFSTLTQIRQLQKAGCDIIRMAVPDEIAARNIKEIKRKISIPLVADIHFNHKLALMAINAGADKIRINPGNIEDKGKLREIVMAAKKAKIPVRIGVNSGSFEKFSERKRGEESYKIAKKMVAKAVSFVKYFENNGFADLVISLKASDVLTTIYAYKLMAEKCDYPFHLGITEAGTLFNGTIKSAMGIGALLCDGIGDTIRVSLASNPSDEVKVGKQILKFLNLKKEGVDLIVCPTCGRCEIDIFKIADKVEKAVINIRKPLKLAVMGCSVNGPGEAKEADLGIAGGKKLGLIFKQGKIIKKVREENLVREFLKELSKLNADEHKTRGYKCTK